jgi:hypothetical protein
VIVIPAAEVVIVGFVPSTLGALPDALDAIMGETVDVRASWKPRPTLLADDGLVPSLQADSATAAMAAAIPDAVRVRRLVRNGRIDVIVRALLEVRRIRNDGNLPPAPRSLRDVTHGTAIIAVTPLADLTALTAHGVVRMSLPGRR